MSHVWIEIESLVLDGLQMDPAKGRRLARLTEMALERLLRERGISPEVESAEVKETKAPDVRVPAAANEARWAEELAQSLYRALDRMA